MTPADREEAEEALFETWWEQFTAGCEHKAIGKSLARHAFIKGLRAKTEQEDK